MLQLTKLYTVLKCYKVLNVSQHKMLQILEYCKEINSQYYKVINVGCCNKYLMCIHVLWISYYVCYKVVRNRNSSPL